MTDDRLLKLSDVARLTDTPIGTVRRWVREERIPVERILIGVLKLPRIRVRASVIRQKFPHVNL